MTDQDESGDPICSVCNNTKCESWAEDCQRNDCPWSAAPVSRDELDAANARIAELEAKVAELRQQRDFHFQVAQTLGNPQAVMELEAEVARLKGELDGVNELRSQLAPIKGYIGP